MDAPQENTNAALAPPNTQDVSTNDIINSCRVKQDPGWQHVAFRKERRTCIYTCLHCSKICKGGGINRLKQHLAGVEAIYHHALKFHFMSVKKC